MWYTKWVEELECEVIITRTFTFRSSDWFSSYREKFMVNDIHSYSDSDYYWILLQLLEKWEKKHEEDACIIVVTDLLL